MGSNQIDATGTSVRAQVPRFCWSILVSFLALIVVAVGAAAQELMGDPAFAQGTLLRTSAEPPNDERLKGSLGTVQIPFVANQGQVDSRVACYASTFAGTVYVTRTGKIVYSLAGKPTSVRTQGGRDAKEARPGWTLTETFVRGKSRPRVENQTQTQVSL